MPAPVAPPPVTTQSAPTPPGESRTTIAPGVLEQAEQEAQERAAARQAEARAQQASRSAPRAAAPAAQPASAPAEPQVTDEAAPVADPAPVVAAPVAAPPVETLETSAAPAAVAPDAAPQGNNSTIWLIVAALGGLAVVVAGIAMMRRRRPVEAAPAYVADEQVSFVADPEAAVPVPTPTVAPDPIAAAPAFIAPRPVAAPLQTARPKPVAAEERSGLQHPELVEPEAEDVAAIIGERAPQGSRPHLELGMRPTRAGVGRRDAIVEFELTIANSGGLPAEDVRVGAFMLGAGSATSSEIERMLVSPPVDSIVPAERIAPGDGTRLDAAVTLPRDQVEALVEASDGFTPVLVADARYRLPDGREGRTAAAFTIGRVHDDGGAELVPIALHDDPSMYDDIEARLHSVAARV
ncbi:MAG: hypothetical protein CVT77_07515 [Alphaproteobacteria bacterium HGW-Alphaproteobacteria-16]|nr:MAG: hypothetical protein CVT77_07515 [Alphaproteobacteria bacterium HGW-Alphaproteobacteria-16]